MMESEEENNSAREEEEEEDEEDESSLGGSSIELEPDADAEMETVMDGNDFQKPVPEASVNVSATIMLKVPTYSLAPLRQCFEAEPDGLNLYQFLKAFVANMDLESDQDLISVVPDLVEFFDLVDIDGDGSMQWSEFVMFVIELVVKEEVGSILEEFALVNRHPVQPPGSQSVVTCCKYIPELNKICLGVGNELQLYDGVENSPTWLSEGARLKLKRKPLINEFNPNSASPYTSTRSSADKKELVLTISDLIFIDSKDIMAVLRTDLCIEFFRFTSRTVASADLILSFGFHFLPRPYTRLACRDKSKEILCLFGVSSHKDIDCWEVVVGKVGPVKLENQILLKQHTDFVRDIVVINNDSYSLFATGGMDRVVYIWDLDTLKHKATRTGFSAGVQCVAFDGKSILLAGSFDFQIIGWDLDAHINKPILTLWGHNSCISKIVSFGAYNRCFSLDQSGVINMWDTSKTSSTDKEGRLIDTITYVEDHVYCFSVMQKNVSQFHTLNGLILVAQGRHQHVYKVKDISTKLSVPILVLYSLPLQMVITVHTKDVVFWSAINGEERNRITNITTSEVLCATLDNRCRKLIVGTSNGIISVYNCLKAAKIKSFPPLPAAVRFLLYSPDKTIICITGAGDMHIMDDLLPEDKLADSVMRECRAHESDVVSIAYSYQLGIIATADTVGLVMVWDYQYLSAEVILTEALAAEVGQVIFMDPYPFLLLCDNFNCFTVIPVGPAAASLGRKHWKVTPIIHRPPHKHKNDHTEGGSDVHLTLDDHASLSHSAVDDSLVGSDSHAHQHVLSTKRMRKFLEEKNDVKCVTIHHNYNELVADNLELTAELLITTTQSLEVGAETSTDRWEGKKVEQSILPNNFQFVVFTGHEDGTISSFDFTKALKDINVPAMQIFETAPRKKGYDPRKITVFRKLRSADYIRVAYSESDVSDGESLTSCQIVHVWHAHKGAFHSMQVIGDEHLLLTAGEDFCVNLFSQVGVLRGVLTRGQVLDMKLKPRWINPIDMVAREAQRLKESKRLIKLLSLKRTVNVNKEIIDPFSNDILAIRRALKSRSHQQHNELHSAAQDAGLKEEASVEESHHSISSLPKPDSKKKTTPTSARENLSMTKYNPHHPPRELLIGQLRGEVTYELSSKDYAKLVMAHKAEEANKIAIRVKNSNILADKTPGTTYLNELLKDSNVGGSVKVPINTSGKTDKSSIYLKRNSQPFAHKSGKTKVKSKYDLESEQIELSDPMNWDIKSVNRQRSLYGHLYDEMAKSQLTKDPHKVMVTKLNALSPNGDFTTFAQTIKSQRKVAKLAITQSLLLSASAPSLIPTQTLPREDLNEGLMLSTSTASIDKANAKSFDNRIIPPGKETSNIMKSNNSNSEKGEMTGIAALQLSSEMEIPPRVPSRSPIIVPNPKASKDKGIFKVSHLASPRMDPLEDLYSPDSPQPLPGVKSPRFSCKADLKKYLSEKEKTLDLLKSFDSKIEVVEKVYRRAKKQSKKHLKTLNQVNKTPGSSNISSIPVSESLPPGSLIPSAGQPLPVGKLHALRRHSSAQILIKKQSSMDGLVEIGARKLKVEESINRKLRLTMSHNDSPKRRDTTSLPSSLPFSAPSYKLPTRNSSKMRSPILTVDGDVFATALSYTAPEGHDDIIEPLSSNIKTKTSEKGSPVLSRMNSGPRLEESPPSSRGRIKAGEQDMGDVKRKSNDRDGDEDDDDEDYDKFGEEGQEVVPTAESATSDKVGDLHLTYEPNLQDHTALHLQQLLNHHLVKDRPQFYDAINNLLEYKAQEETVPVRQITAPLSEVAHFLSPYLTKQERQNCAAYIKKVIIRDQYQQFQVEEDETHMSEQQKGALHSLFTFFDKDKSGTVNLREIMEVVKQTNMNSRSKKSDFDLLDAGFAPSITSSSRRKLKTPEGNKNDNLIDEAMIRNMINTIDRDFNEELDFEEFFVLFSSTLR